VTTAAAVRGDVCQSRAYQGAPEIDGAPVMVQRTTTMDAIGVHARRDAPSGRSGRGGDSAPIDQTNPERERGGTWKIGRRHVAGRDLLPRERRHHVHVRRA